MKNNSAVHAANEQPWAGLTHDERRMIKRNSGFFATACRWSTIISCVRSIAIRPTRNSARISPYGLFAYQRDGVDVAAVIRLGAPYLASRHQI
jgi:hypothetical protein